LTTFVFHDLVHVPAAPDFCARRVGADNERTCDVQSLFRRSYVEHFARAKATGLICISFFKLQMGPELKTPAPFFSGVKFVNIFMD